MRWKLALAAIASTAALAAAPAYANTYYAAPASGGTNDCTTPDDACSIQDAFTAASTNSGADEIVLAPGDYGSAADPIPDWLSDNSQPLNVHGSPWAPKPRIFSSSDGSALGVYNSASAVRDVALEWTGSSGSAIEATAGTIDNVVVHSTSGGALILNGGDSTIVRNSILTSDYDALGAYAVRAQRGAVGTLTVTLRNVTIVGNSANADGLEVGAPGTGSHVIANVYNSIVRGAVGGTGDAGGVYADAQGSGATATVTLDHSNFTRATYLSHNSTVTDPSAPGNQSAAPLFADAAQGDFHEAVGSPTIDAGADDFANGLTDFEGENRTSGAATDIGADEAVPSIAGTVRDDNGDPLAGVCVTAFDDSAQMNPDAFGPGAGTALGVTDDLGNYTITPLSPGDWRLMFRDCVPSGSLHGQDVATYATQFSGGALGLDAADPISLSASERSQGNDAQLQPGGYLSGHVTNSAGTPLAGVCVAVWTPADLLVDGALTDVNGDYLVGTTSLYDLGPVAPGSYRVRFAARPADCSFATAGDYDVRYYDGQPSAAAATPVQIAAGTETSGVNAVLLRPGEGATNTTQNQNESQSQTQTQSAQGEQSVAGAIFNLARGLRLGVVRVGRDGRFKLPGTTITCGAVACTVTGTVTATLPAKGKPAVAARKRKVVLGRTTFSIAPRQTKAVRLKLSRKGLAALRKAKRLKASVKLVAAGSSKTLTLTLKAPRRR